MPVLDPLHPLGIKSGALWLIEGDHRYACFLYAPSAHAEPLKKFFEGRTLGSVMCDGSATNNCVEKEAGGRRGGCNAHGRRGLVEALRRGDARAVEGLDRYAKIFHVDAESKRLGESIDQRFERRLRQSVPFVEELRAWLDRRLGDVEPRLTAFLRDPLMELTNNEVEGGLRTWAVGRKNWLFVGSDDGGAVNAIFTSLLASCGLCGVEPWTYLRDLFCLLPRWSEHHLLDLAPVAWTKTRERADVQRILDQNPFRKLTLDARG
jgi:transposase